MNTAPNVRIIPAKISEEEKKKQYHQLRVAAYCRISTDLEEQQNSYEVQVEYYTDYILCTSNWCDSLKHYNPQSENKMGELF